MPGNVKIYSSEDNLRDSQTDSLNLSADDLNSIKMTDLHLYKLKQRKCTYKTFAISGCN